MSVIPSRRTVATFLLVLGANIAVPTLIAFAAARADAGDAATAVKATAAAPAGASRS